MRIGAGFDVHRLVEGRKLILGGVDIPFEKGLDGHSDADVAVHALMDAILGALALGDIGQHFPPSDETYRGADSMKLLSAVVSLMKEKGYRIYLLSNYSEDFFRVHTKDASFMDELDGKVVSYEIHKIKPDAAIYMHLLDKYQLDAKECVFFDDRQENTKAAEELGIRSYTITSKEYLLSVLDAYLK
jgi:FMN phosphatase YigB (HAD superfamily)